MAKIIGVRFRNTGKIYYFSPMEQEIDAGAAVIVETAQGVELGDVLIGTKEVPDSEIVAPLKNIIRVATPEDMEKLKSNQEKEKRAYKIAEEKIQAKGLDMKLVRVEYTFDCGKIVFYFTSDERVDFRELVKDMATTFRTRIELRQIGVRDEVKMLGGLGPCGLPCCCNAFLGGFQPVSIKMAKEQGLSLNPTKISGLCGRLMCCLKYEQSHYEQTRRHMPAVNAEVTTADGEGRVFSINPLKELVKVKIQLPGDQIDLREYPLDKIKVLRQPRQRPEEPEAELPETE